MKQLIILSLIIMTSTAYGQVKVNGKVPYTVNQEMLLKSANEQKLYVKEHYKGLTFGLWGLGFASLSLAAAPDDVEFFYIGGGALALVGAYFSIKAPLHLKKSAAYVEASVTGVRISF